jgi:putative membrane protein
MDNPSTKYFLDGFYSLPISMSIYMLLLFAISLLWLGLIWFYVELKRSNYLLSYIFLLFYTEFLCVLFVWKGNFDNINFAIIALPILILFNFIVKRIRNILYTIIAPILIFAYAKYCYEYISQMTLYENIFATHRNYKWNHERAGGIITTYSFERFDDALRLINKYSKNSNELYMISKYDNMLQFFSKKYSGLKYFELKSFIVTDNEYNEVLDLINSKADILYVDTDILNVYYKELKERRFFDVYNNQWLPNDVMRRIIQLKILLSLFDDVRDKYELIEHGKLIDVYKKKKE